MKELTFPYTIHCRFCKVSIKVKSKEMVGKRVNCPKCKKRIDIVTPDEDAVVPYLVEAPPEPEPEPEPTEEELEEIEFAKAKVRRKETIAKTKHVMSIIFLILILGGIAFVFYKWVYTARMEERKKQIDDDPRRAMLLNQPFERCFPVESEGGVRGTTAT